MPKKAKTLTIKKEANFAAPVQAQEEDLLRTGEDCSLYVSKAAMQILKRLVKATRRSRSMIVSLFVEKYGPEIEKDPKSLIV